MTGPGGIGKTRLALAVATQLATQGAFPHGVWYIPLAAITDPDLVPGAIAQALAVRETTGLPAAEAIASFLQDRHTLLVVDNCEQILPGLRILADWLAAAPRLSILATSRERLRLNAERVFPVQPLAIPDHDLSPDAQGATHGAVALFSARAQAVDPTFTLNSANHPIVAEICRRLDGLPLAIELAAARCAVLSPSMLLDRLERRLPLLTTAARDLPARQQTLRNTIAWSYDLLSDPEQRLFRHLAVFAGGFALETAEAIGSPPHPSYPSSRLPVFPSLVLDGITALTEKNLIVREATGDGDVRFTMLETLREFALERLEAAGEAPDARQRHADAIVQFAQQHAPVFGLSESIGWVTRVDLEAGNLRAAFDWTIAQGRADDTARLVAVLARLWARRGQLREGRQLLDHAVRVSGDAAPALRGRLLFYSGGAALYLGDYPAAEERLLAADALYRASGDLIGRAFGLYYLAACAEYQDDDATAVARYQETLVLAKEIGNRELIGNVLSCLADAAYRRGDLEAALSQELSSLQLLREVDDTTGVVLALTGVAQAACALGDLEGALGYLKEAIVAAADLSYVVGVADALHGIATVASASGDLDRSASLLGAAAAAQDRAGFPVLPHHTQQGRTTEHVRDTLGQDAFAAAFAAGRTLPMADAIALARATVIPQPQEDSGIPTNDSGVDLAPDSAAARAGLTPREVEILRLLVARQTDNEIAAECSISPRTVATHVGRIRDKLGVHSRRAAADVAVRDGLI